MNVPVVVTPAARQDIFDLADYLAEQSLEVAEYFLDQVEKTFERLSQMPEIGSLCRLTRSDVENVRVWPVGNFSKHLIFYRLEKERILVIRIMHGSQDWMSYL